MDLGLVKAGSSLQYSVQLFSTAKLSVRRFPTAFAKHTIGLTCLQEDLKSVVGLLTPACGYLFYNDVKFNLNPLQIGICYIFLRLPIRFG